MKKLETFMNDPVGYSLFVRWCSSGQNPDAMAHKREQEEARSQKREEIDKRPLPSVVPKEFAYGGEDARKIWNADREKCIREAEIIRKVSGGYCRH